MDLSYIPLYDVRTTDVTTNGRVHEDKRHGIRHGFRWALRTKFNDRVAIENLLWVKPFHSIGRLDIVGDDLNLSNDLKVVFNLAENFFFDYNFVYQRDKLWRTLNDLPETNTINSINLRYDWDI